MILKAHDVEYSSDVEGKTIMGRAKVFARNYTAGDACIWSGFIVGVGSSEKNFHSAMQQAAVTLLTLQFDEKWFDMERSCCWITQTRPGGLGAVPELMTNSTVGDFNVIVSNAAYKMVRTYTTMIAGFLAPDTKEELHLPLFPY